MKSTEYLKFPWIDSFKQLNLAGVALRRVGANFHIGVLYRDDTDEVVCLHLAYHLDLRKDPPGKMHAWIQLPSQIWPTARLEAISGMWELVWLEQEKLKEQGKAEKGKPHHGVPYAFRFVESRATPEGKLEIATGEYGFTCATFVLALFRAAVTELVDVDNWPARADDANWHRAMIEYLRCDDDLPEGVSHEDIENHLEHLESEVGCARFRPEEVAAAASRTEYPVHHDDAWRMGEEVAAVMRAAV